MTSDFDPPYTTLSTDCQGHWTAGDLMYGGFLDWGPALVQERVPWTDPPIYRAKIAKHRKFLEECRKEYENRHRSNR